ncbi:hypothetical protein GCM10010103_57770 [Streptomyces paradoxus]
MRRGGHPDSQQTGTRATYTIALHRAFTHPPAMPPQKWGVELRFPEGIARTDRAVPHSRWSNSPSFAPATKAATSADV